MNSDWTKSCYKQVFEVSGYAALEMISHESAFFPTNLTARDYSRQEAGDNYGNVTVEWCVIT